MEEMDLAGKEDHLEGLEGILDEAEEEVEHMRYWSLVQFNSFAFPIWSKFFS